VNDRNLVIGYGNSLRADDGVGRYVAERLAGDVRLAGATVIGVHQLAPELALDISRADLLVLVDAGRGPVAGTFTIELAQRSYGAGPTWSHHLDPASLLGLADELYGCSPDTYVVTIGVESVEVGDRLSPAVETALPQVIDAIVELVGGQAANKPATGAARA
jgi:hydrogenase maturation protease